MGELKEKPAKKWERARLSFAPEPENKSMQVDGTWVSLDFKRKIKRVETPRDMARLEEARKNTAKTEETRKEKGEGRLLRR